jgi:replication factor C subunit 3/5
MSGMEGIPWVEKYRPDRFEDIILNKENQTVFESMLAQNYIPNLLLYGPPGTGKTTTVLNLIGAYQKKHNELNKGLLIHLNASDERGIDVIRTQLQTFVNSKSFYGGVKFIILDEVDSMTKIAQQALGLLIQEHVDDVRLCLICNYISKIDSILQSMFVKIKFNKLPEDKVLHFLRNITVKENVAVLDSQLAYIQNMYESDMRSMINHLQCNNGGTQAIVHNGLWDELYQMVEAKQNVVALSLKVSEISLAYNMDKYSLLKDFLYYGMLNGKINLDCMLKLQFAVHASRADSDHLVTYVFLVLLKN